MRRRLPSRALVCALVSIGAAGLVPAQVAHADTSATSASGVVAAKPRVIAGGKAAAFVSPSGNITCLMTLGRRGRADVRCDITQHSWRAPKKPATCELDWGNVLVLGRRAAFACVGDTVAGSAQIGGPGAGWFRSKRDVVVREYGVRNAGLRYGYGLRVGDVTCVSQPKGVTCTNSLKHGFTVSKASYRLR